MTASKLFPHTHNHQSLTITIKVLQYIGTNASKFKNILEVGLMKKLKSFLAHLKITTYSFQHHHTLPRTEEQNKHCTTKKFMID